jgi:outer membrane protein assembly factor BamB
MVSKGSCKACVFRDSPDILLEKRPSGVADSGDKTLYGKPRFKLDFWKITMKRKNFIPAFIVLALAASTYASDWPQWRGPARDGNSNEKGLLEKWPAEGPKMLWHTTGLGEGFSSIAISKGTIYTTGKFVKTEYLFAMDMAGKIKWKKESGRVTEKYYPEARSTPTVDGNRVYVIGGRVDIACFNAKTGDKIWSVDGEEKFGAKYGHWGAAESALIVDNKVIVTPGGPDATMVALDKTTGETIWTTKGLSEKSSYCSPLLIERGGKKIIVSTPEKYIIGVDASSGIVLWKHERKSKWANPNTPLYRDGRIYATSGYGAEGILIELSEDGTSVTEKWKNEILDTHHGGVVLVDGCIYGSNWDGEANGKWVCLDWKTGDVKYETDWHRKGSIIHADGMLYCYEEDKGNFGLVKATPSKFEVVSEFRVPMGKGMHWAHPAISDGKLYIRHGDVLMCYDIKAQ